MNKMKLLTTLILGSGITCNASMIKPIQFQDEYRVTDKTMIISDDNIVEAMEELKSKNTINNIILIISENETAVTNLLIEAQNGRADTINDIIMMAKGVIKEQSDGDAMLASLCLEYLIQPEVLLNLPVSNRSTTQWIKNPLNVIQTRALISRAVLKGIIKVRGDGCSNCFANLIKEIINRFGPIFNASITDSILRYKEDIHTIGYVLKTTLNFMLDEVQYTENILYYLKNITPYINTLSGNDDMRPIIQKVNSLTCMDKLNQSIIKYDDKESSAFGCTYKNQLIKSIIDILEYRDTARFVMHGNPENILAKTIFDSLGYQNLIRLVIHGDLKNPFVQKAFEKVKSICLYTPRRSRSKKSLLPEMIFPNYNLLKDVIIHGDLKNPFVQKVSDLFTLERNDNYLLPDENILHYIKIWNGLTGLIIEGNPENPFVHRAFGELGYLWNHLTSYAVSVDPATPLANGVLDDYYKLCKTLLYRSYIDIESYVNAVLRKKINEDRSGFTGRALHTLMKSFINILKNIDQRSPFVEGIFDIITKTITSEFGTETTASRSIREMILDEFMDSMNQNLSIDVMLCHFLNFLVIIGGNIDNEFAMENILQYQKHILNKSPYSAYDEELHTLEKICIDLKLKIAQKKQEVNNYKFACNALKKLRSSSPYNAIKTD